MKFLATIHARKAGAIGALGTERRTYTIETDSREDVARLAIDAAYREGGLEHVTVTRVQEVGQ